MRRDEGCGLCGAATGFITSMHVVHMQSTYNHFGSKLWQDFRCALWFSAFWLSAFMATQEEVWVIRLRRNPSRLHIAIEDETELADCRRDMMLIAADLPLFECMSPFVFCAPHQTEPIIKHLFRYGVRMVPVQDRDRDDAGTVKLLEDIASHHLVVTNSFLPAVTRARKSLPSKLRTCVREEGRFTLVEMDGQCIVFDIWI